VNDRTRNPTPPNTHAACGTTWTAASAAHCSGCCRTFSGVALFDRHRSKAGGEHGSCIDPATLTDTNDTPICEQRDGMWRGPEMTEEQKLARFGARAEPAS
jgi:hypothetical protein